VYNLTGIFSNSLTPRMVNSGSGGKSSWSFYTGHQFWLLLAWVWGAKTGLFYAGTNLLCLIWCLFRLPETKDRTFGEIDLLFDNKIPARKFKYTTVDRKSPASFLSFYIPKKF
jgi:SP family general alpha glucoside:H+ symporter-like MFS transporter